MEKLSAEFLKAAVEGKSRLACSCALGPCAGWESFTEERWPKDLIRPLGTLRDAEIYEPTTDEFHPDGTRYESPAAPVAVNFSPYNRSDVFECGRCEKVLLRYTEFGGYYVDHRVREVDAALVI
jgi:hypothetical protein